jgi:hypothetical protein
MTKLEKMVLPSTFASTAELRGAQAWSPAPSRDAAVELVLNPGNTNPDDVVPSAVGVEEALPEV